MTDIFSQGYPVDGILDDDPVYGKCCSCGYNREEETECPAREDRTHCEHWWDGPEKEERK